MSYRVSTTKAAEAELDEFPEDVRKSLIVSTLMIAKDPFSRDLHGRTKILEGFDYIFRFKDGNKRILYTADPVTKEMTVLSYVQRTGETYDKSALRSLKAKDKAEKDKRRQRRGAVAVVAALAQILHRSGVRPV